MLPARNRRDYEDIPDEVRRTIEFIWLDNVDEAVAAALEPRLHSPEPRRSCRRLVGIKLGVTVRS